MDRKTFHQQFTIHPVGQGLFYSCTIKRQQKVVFRMVFDCGSKTKDAGKEEVIVYRDTDFLNEKKLDLLVISHFDSDHVNHIGKLLDGEIKIKRLVMPFISFEERLFLTLKLLNENDGYKNEIDYTARLILDPLTTLAGNLDNDFEVYLVESDPENPILPNDNDGFGVENRDDRRLIFEFPSTVKEDIQGTTVINLPSVIEGKVYKIKDSIKGAIVDPQSRLLLVEFLFYKKSIGDKEKQFYEKVKELFFEQQEIDNYLEGEKLLEAVSEKIKKISSSKKVVEVFEKAAEEVSMPKKEVSNPNTTALCMLHRNMRYITDYVAEDQFSSDKYYKYWYPNFYNIQKFIADKSSRIIKENYFPYLMDDYMWRHRYREDDFCGFPNVLLTSDCFLLNKNDVNEFLKKYQHYLSDFWLFQIPHHGSKENSDAVLHSSIPFQSSCFINYGTGNIHKHPSAEVIESLVVSGLSINLFSVNEYQGLKFVLNLEVSKK